MPPLGPLHGLEGERVDWAGEDSVCSKLTNRCLQLILLYTATCHVDQVLAVDHWMGGPNHHLRGRPGPLGGVSNVLDPALNAQV